MQVKSVLRLLIAILIIAIAVLLLTTVMRVPY
jgi:hypothetical protein